MVPVLQVLQVLWVMILLLAAVFCRPRWLQGMAHTPGHVLRVCLQQQQQHAGCHSVSLCCLLLLHQLLQGAGVLQCQQQLQSMQAGAQHLPCCWPLQQLHLCQQPLTGALLSCLLVVLPLLLPLVLVWRAASHVLAVLSCWGLRWGMVCCTWPAAA